MKLIFLFIGVVIVAVLLTMAVQRQQDYRANNPKTVVTAQPMPTASSSDSMQAKMEQALLDNPDTQKSILKDVTDGESRGEAYILRSDAGLTHTVVAMLPTPPKGEVYEGWLVNKSVAGSFFSTGVMSVNQDGMYELVYEAGNSYESHNTVVITQETVVDATPEKHVLEGSF